MELEVRHLRVVCAVADHGSLNRAAAALGISQPALTRQVQRLERALGGPLFTRDGNGTTLTALGSYVLSRARAVLPAMDELNSGAAHHASGTPARLHYGAVLGPLAAGLLPALRELRPDAEIRFRTEQSNALLVDLLAGRRLELAALLEFPGYETELRAGVLRHVVATEPVFVLLPETHPAVGLEAVPLAELADEEWALEPPDDNRFREYFTLACHDAGFPPKVGYEAEAGSYTDLISSGQAIGLGQATFRRHAGVVVRPLAGDPMWASHVLVWQNHGPLAAVAGELVAAAERVYRTAVDRSPVYLDWLAAMGESERR
ncbi:LysR family transcriptional regulator [Amycolatopsis sp. 195334CR]|uniref:LysR family transcriptional regulator n=1 Tax=Amycolatopsis sp. 195334CR TaxID=2814588 RepID=UPI001A8C7D2B|nr:LysR family transcriptional regulator [Amycolatopsis sp. 195334CR]MBN6040320.1 LysR family transcriptional regulator [Amycolatopsis sp. 195334CR]